MRTPKSRHRAAEAVPLTVVGDCESPSDAGSRQEHISTAAYFKAQARDFAPGHEVEDWLQAEQEYEAPAAVPQRVGEDN